MGTAIKLTKEYGAKASRLCKFISKREICQLLPDLWGVSPTEAMLPIAASQKLPVIAETTVKEATLNKPLVIRAARTGERIARALAAELKHRKIKSVSLVVTEIPFYTDIVQHLEKLLAANGIVVRSRKDILPSESDFKSLLLDRTPHLEEMLGVFLLPSQLITFFRQADQAKFPLKAFNADILDSESIVNECPANINGTFFTQVGVTSEFRKKYLLAFGNDIQIGSAAQAYDVVAILSELFGNLDKKLSSGEVIDLLSTISPHSGATGSFKYSDTPDGGKEIRMPVSMKEVRNLKIVTITEDTGF